MNVAVGGTEVSVGAGISVLVDVAVGVDVFVGGTDVWVNACVLIATVAV